MEYTVEVTLTLHWRATCYDGTEQEAKEHAIAECRAYGDVVCVETAIPSQDCTEASAELERWLL